MPFGQYIPIFFESIHDIFGTSKSCGTKLECLSFFCICSLTSTVFFLMDLWASVFLLHLTWEVSEGGGERGGNAPFHGKQLVFYNTVASSWNVGTLIFFLTWKTMYRTKAHSGCTVWLSKLDCNLKSYSWIYFLHIWSCIDMFYIRVVCMWTNHCLSIFLSKEIHLKSVVRLSIC